MLILNIHGISKSDLDDLCFRICESLQGSPAFVSNEIVVSDADDKRPFVRLFIGNHNDRDIMYDLHSEELHKIKDWGESYE